MDIARSCKGGVNMDNDKSKVSTPFDSAVNSALSLIPVCDEYFSNTEMLDIPVLPVVKRPSVTADKD